MDFSFSFSEFSYQGSANVLFEDRSVRVENKQLEDMIDAYGTRIYRIKYKALTNTHAKVHPKNKVKDGSFEKFAELGVPSACYARPMGDKGATYFTDSRTKAHGTHSIRMTTPSFGSGMALSFYHTGFEPGISYTLSIRAKALPFKYRQKVKRGFLKKLCDCGVGGDDYPEFRLSLGSNCEEYFIPGKEWEEYSFSCVPVPADGKYRVSPLLELIGEGTAWFDLLQMYPDMSITLRTSRESNNVDVHLTSTHQGSDIYYTTDGSMPGPDDEKYVSLFSLDRPATVKAAAYIDGIRVGYLERYVEVSLATGRYVEYKNNYSPKYNGGYKDGLVNGILATPDYKDGKWQGFEGDDFDVIINLKNNKQVKELELRFLENKASWIFLPEKIQISWSADGNKYYHINAEGEENIVQDKDGIFRYIFSLAEGIEARYFQIKAVNIGTCPEGHPGAGGKAWLFTDEIIIR